MGMYLSRFVRKITETVYKIIHFQFPDPMIENAVVESGLSNHVVIRHILSHLTLNELKQCRLVNKFWKLEVDSYIRDFRQCYAKISGPSPCTDLKALAHFLSKLTTYCSVINGLSITLRPRMHSEDCRSDQEPHSLCAQLMEKVVLKYLEISWNAGSDDCLAIKHVATLLDINMENLRRLEIQALPDNLGGYIREDWEPLLPKLEVLTTDYTRPLSVCWYAYKYHSCK